MTPSASPSSPQPDVYQGQFGEFTITAGDRQSVVYYRAALGVATACFGCGVAILVMGPNATWVMPTLTGLYWGFIASLGASLLLIHIYLAALHRTLQAFWLIGAIASAAITLYYPEPLPLAVYQHPLTVLGIGFVFAALTGIFFKEAFCFNRLETKLLTPLVPLVLLGHLTNILPDSVAQSLLVAWATLMVVFATRKAIQAIPPDIGDKSVFNYLKQQRQAKSPG